MFEYVRMERLPNGNLRMHLTSYGSGWAEAVETTRQYGGNDVEKLRHMLRTTDYHIIRPEQIGALTDAPIIGDNEETLVWWYPAYEVRDCVEIAVRDGYVDFELAPEE